MYKLARLFCRNWHGSFVEIGTALLWLGSLLQTHVKSRANFYIRAQRAVYFYKTGSVEDTKELWCSRHSVLLQKSPKSRVFPQKSPVFPHRWCVANVSGDSDCRVDFSEWLLGRERRTLPRCRPGKMEKKKCNVTYFGHF